MHTQIICVITLGCAPFHFISILSVFAFAFSFCLVYLRSLLLALLLLLLLHVYMFSEHTIVVERKFCFNRSCTVQLHLIPFHSKWAYVNAAPRAATMIFIHYTKSNNSFVWRTNVLRFFCLHRIIYIDIFCWHLKHSQPEHRDAPEREQKLLRFPPNNEQIMNYHNIVEVWRAGANHKGRGRLTELEHTIIYLTRTLHTHLNKTEYLRTLSDIT